MKILEHFSRVTTAGRNFIPQIDGLRFLAVLGVLAFHIREIVSFHFGVDKDNADGLSGVVSRAFASGSQGVQLFFAISGFILVLPFARQYLQQAAPVSLRAYFFRRITRLEPPYIIHLVFLFLMCALVYRHVPTHLQLYHNEHWMQYSLTHLLASLVYVNGFIYGTHPSPNIVLWSLEVEVQFYILAPLLAKLFKISTPVTRRLTIAGLILLASLAKFLAPPHLYFMECSLVGNVQFFLVGFLLCDFYLSNWGDAPGRNIKWDLLFMLVGAVILSGYYLPGYLFLFPWLILLCCCAAFKGQLCRPALSNPWIATIGGMCYTIYMYHWIMISGLVRGTSHLQTQIFGLDLIVQLVVMSVIIIVCCSILFVFFERPFMRRDWPTRFLAVVFRKKSDKLIP
jgi:peptidoglycan/LPS O-acetylase OafA/YrhL